MSVFLALLLVVYLVWFLYFLVYNQYIYTYYYPVIKLENWKTMIWLSKSAVKAKN